MKTELEVYLSLLTESVELFGHFTKGLDDEALGWKPEGFEKSAGAVVLEACLDVQEELGKEIIERKPRATTVEPPAPTRANVDEAIGGAAAFIQWHKSKLTEQMLAETRTRTTGAAQEQVTVREMLVLLLRHLGNHIGWVRLLTTLWKAQHEKAGTG